MNRKNIKTPVKMSSNQISKINLSSQVPVLPTEVGKGNRKGSDVIQYWGGNANNYPNHLNMLFAKSPIHQGIIKMKSNYILGDKIIYKNNKNLADFKVNNDETITQLLDKVIKDFLIYNIFSIEVIYNGVGEPIEWNHLPAKFVRTNKAKTSFWYCTDWAESSPKTIEFEGWKSNRESDYTSKIFWYSSYNAGINQVYFEPEYFAAIKSIETDIAISDFHNNNINTNFSASSIITFHNGEPTEDVKNLIEKTITESYTGTSGKKLIINFANEESKPAEVTSISPSTWNDAFLTLKEDVIQDIVIAHNITSGMLIGIKSEGQLGGSTEQDASFKIFKSKYVNKKRDEILGQINKLFSGVFDEIDIIDEEEIDNIENNSVLTQICTIDELRKMKGLPPLLNNAGNRLMNEQPQPVQQSNFSENKKDDEDELKFNSIKDFGDDINSYVVLHSSNFNNDKLTNYLIDNSPFTGKSLSDIRADLNEDYSIQSIKDELSKLVATNVIDKNELISDIDIKKAQKDLNITSNNQNTPNINRIEVRYSYFGPKDDKNRAFCSKLVSNNKLYTREDIQSMSEVIGMDIYTHKGGKNCRHTWKKHTVVRKNDGKGGQNDE
ncbi:hypothetical protein GEO21_21650 [Sphingobacterium faecium]|uniref:hypothetical protein n=1 Tax=Sphingobacterium faecium TaxID=34087 RepID=UPI001290AAD3|nr:hypothetical protein [Sphingobacterium faecium]MQP30091.1 hypothetical protein [Sphingobacterium faecium]